MAQAVSQNRMLSKILSYLQTQKQSWSLEDPNLTQHLVSESVYGHCMKQIPHHRAVQSKQQIYQDMLDFVLSAVRTICSISPHIEELSSHTQQSAMHVIRHKTTDYIEVWQHKK